MAPQIGVTTAQYFAGTATLKTFDDTEEGWSGGLRVVSLSGCCVCRRDEARWNNRTLRVLDAVFGRPGGLRL
jgi:hypothetical protein